MLLGAVMFVLSTQHAVVVILTPSIGSLSSQLVGLIAGFIYGITAFRAFDRIAVGERTMSPNDIMAMIYRPTIFPFWALPYLIGVCIRYPFLGLMILLYVAAALAAVILVQKHRGRPFSWLVCTIYGVCVTVSIPAVGSWLHVLLIS